MKLEFDLESLIIGAVIGFVAGILLGYLLQGMRGGVVMERNEKGDLVAVLPLQM